MNTYDVEVEVCTYYRIHHDGKVVFERQVDSFGDNAAARAEAEAFAEMLKAHPPPPGEEAPFGTCYVCKGTRSALYLRPNEILPDSLVCVDCSTPVCRGCGERHGFRYDQEARRDRCKGCGSVKRL